MNQSKSTKKALITSFISLVLSCAMLFGTTFAWFTDNATSSNNRIVAGDLEVDLLMDKAETGKYVSIAGGNGDIFAEANGGNGVSWEPGKTEIVYLAVRNTGTLALKYNIVLEIIDGGLADALEYAIIDGGTADNVTATSWASIKTNADAQTGKVTAGSLTVAPNGRLNEQDDTDYFAVAVHMADDAGNEYQGESITIDLTLMATQAAYEEDSFGKNYDKNAAFEKDEADTSDLDFVSDGLYIDKTGTYYISNAKGLATMRTTVADTFTYDDDGVWVLLNDISLAGINWEPIDEFHGTFDGNGKVISDLTITGSEDNVGLFGTTSLGGDGFTGGTVIKNFTIRKANISGNESVGVVAGNMMYVTIEKVNVEEATVNGNEFVGGIIGRAYGTGGATVSECSVADSTIKADNGNPNGKVGGIGGFVGYGTIKNNSVSGSTISGPKCVGGIVGRGGTGDTVAVIYGNSISGNQVSGTDTATVGEQVGDKLNVMETNDEADLNIE